MNFSTSTEQDVKQITEWISRDPYHVDQNFPEWWLTGNGLLAFRLDDVQGPLSYVRLNEEGEYVRMHIQFAPEDIVSKRRVVVGLIGLVGKLVEVYRADKKKGLIFRSISPSLIIFADKNLGFKSAGNNDYRLDFER
jgi:hypothetical protein